MTASLSSFWQTSRFRIDLSHPRIMGIVNVTPDSFSDGSHHATLPLAMQHCEKLLQEGADILDIGGESTRPGSPAVTLEEELRRVLPLVKEAVKLNVPLSVDTYKPEVMRQVLDAGADIINDIWALRQPGALESVARHASCGVCLMHMHNDPQTMQIAPMQGDVPQAVKQFLHAQASRLQQARIASDRIVLDPGIGFGKTVAQNFQLLAQQDDLLELGHAVLAGWSRKSSLGAVTGREVNARMPASITAALLAVQKGATIVRVHDVAATRDALRVWQAVQAPDSC
ncbi:dihydropteroate synthase [Lampropedia hyalina DSM 16112]|jgi:dihydropteroate synthase|uniref:Dihydropteroate synthase n=1 Tax=Lampropedia hyalina DSM 16112 TaxID=1122156 RepID=A0A1M4XQN2_9BURK|nr:dihydropteroate synthase [Lampropedia hyalina]SHE95731.1 dihydropteroate synthase [Lampropedia hyalina DSM 16112]